jgi:hypothetical protein
VSERTGLLTDVSVLWLLLQVIFLRLAELTQGETDVILSAGDWSGYGALNYTLIRYMSA